MLKRSRLKVAIYHNTPIGGAKRVLYDFVRYLNLKWDCDLYEIDYDLSKPDLYGIQVFNNSKLNLTPYCQKKHVVPDFRKRSFKRFRPERFAYLYKSWIKLSDLKAYEEMAEKIAEMINNKKYDIAFVHICKIIQSPPLLKYINIPKVYFCQEPLRRFYENYFRSDNIFNMMNIEEIYLRRLQKIDRENARSADLVLANSYYSKELIYHAYGIDAKVNYLGVDVNTFFSDPSIKKENKVFAPGTLIASKGYIFLLKVLNLVDKGIRPKLVIASVRGGGIRSQMEDYAMNHDINIEFIESPSDEEMRSLYCSSLATLYFPFMEPLGLVPLESMACGTPVLGVKEGGIRESVRDDYVGLLFDRNEKEVAEGITMFLKDKKLRQYLASNCASYIKDNWTIEKSVNTLHSHFENLLDIQ